MKIHRAEPIPLLPPDLAAMVARLDVEIGLPEREVEDAIRAAIADRRGYLDGWHLDDQGWYVTLLYPQREAFRGRTLATALGWCLVWLRTSRGELGIEGFVS